MLVVLLYTPKQNKISGKSKVGKNLVTLPWLLLIIIFNIRRKKTHEDMFLRGKEHEVYSQKWNRKKHFWEKKKYIYIYISKSFWSEQKNMFGAFNHHFIKLNIFLRRYNEVNILQSSAMIFFLGDRIFH